MSIATSEHDPNPEKERPVQLTGAYHKDGPFKHQGNLGDTVSAMTSRSALSSFHSPATLTRQIQFIHQGSLHN